MSDAVGLPAPTALLTSFSVEGVYEVVKSSESIQLAPRYCHQWKPVAATRVVINAKSELPEGAIITSANAYEASFWTRTARLDVVLSDVSERVYFFKVRRRQD